MKHQLPELPFAKNALEPVMSAETLEYHYGKHHKAYVNKLNELIEGTEYADLSLEEIIKRAPAGGLFNNAAQTWNHTFFWNSLTPKARAPQGALAQAITTQFGSVEKLTAELAKAAASQFGSGWGWLVLGKDGKLVVETTSNADTPIKHGRKPLLTVDVWEHAYYIDYRNERPRYLESLAKILNWEFAERNFAAASASSAA